MDYIKAALEWAMATIWPSAGDEIDATEQALMQHQECFTCAQSLDVEVYPRVDGCTHEPDICKECLEAWIKSQIFDFIVGGAIRCPSICDRKFSLFDLGGKISPILFDK